MRTFSRIGLTTLALLFGVSAAHAQAQTREITGTVINAGTSDPVIGAIITVVGRTTAVQANDRGAFRIQVPVGPASLMIRAINYKRATVNVPGSESTVRAVLTRDPLQLEAVTVTGEATSVSRVNAATAVATVSHEALTMAPSQSVDNALQGKVVGANINMNSGAPGGGGQVQIRGVTTILGNGEPLYVVDGVIISNAQIQSGTNSITQAGGGIASSQDNASSRLADLNPNDIESLEVLKSAAASAIYGARASNGVIVITTKRGATGAPRWTFTQRAGQNFSQRRPGSRVFKNKTDAYNAVLADNGDSLSAHSIVDAACGSGTCPFFDYQKDLYGNHRLSYETVGSVSGGNDVTKYFASATTKLDHGTMQNTSARRDGLALNLDQTFRSNVQVNVSAKINRSVGNRGISNNDNTFISPIYAFGYTPAIVNLNTRNAQGQFPLNNIPGGGGSGASNPFQTLAFVRNTEDVYREIASGRVAWDAIQTDRNKITLSAFGGVDHFNQSNDVYSPNFLQFEPNDGFLGTAVDQQTTNRQLNSSLNAIWTFTPNSRLFSSTMAVGNVNEERRLNNVQNLAKGLIPGIDKINQGTASNGQTKTLAREQAYYATEDILAFNDRLFLSGGVRWERSSLDGNQKKFYNYPKFAASYRFVSPFAHIDEVKLRSSLGQTGGVPRYGDRDVLFTNIGREGGSDALGAGQTLGSINIKPERTTEQEYGSDVQLFGQRVNVEFTYFNKTIRDLLLTAPLSPSSGVGVQILNGGKLRNIGHELAVTVVPLRTSSFNWTSRTQYYHLRQTIAELPVPTFILGSSGFGSGFGRDKIAKGVSTTAIWGNTKRFGKCSTAAATDVFTSASCTAAGGTFTAIRKDTIIGDATPQFTMQFNNDMSYKAFSLNVLFDWRRGGKVSNLTNNLFDEGQNSRDYDDKSPDPAIGATLGAYRYNKWAGGSEATVYVQDGSFVKLREITLSYQVPQRAVSWIRGAKDVRLSLSGRNLKIWTNYWGSDPEVNNFGNQNVGRFVDLAPYPPYRSYLFSVDLGF